MRIAALYDIHSNLPALEAVVRDVRQAGADLIVVGGDVVPGPMPRETLAYLLDLDIPMRFIHGNGDRAVLELKAGKETTALPPPVRELARWVAEQLDSGHERIMAGWPSTLRLEVPGIGEVLFCHATPRNDTEIFTRRTPEAALVPVFEGVDASLVVCGHTHMQADRKVGDLRVVNAGSVGMPFGEPGACWLLLGPGVELRRTSYDLTMAAERVRASGYPQAQEFAEKNILRPPSEEEIMDAFARIEVK
jgi:putative phosphoesterase